MCLRPKYDWRLRVSSVKNPRSHWFLVSVRSSHSIMVSLQSDSPQGQSVSTERIDAIQPRTKPGNHSNQRAIARAIRQIGRTVIQGKHAPWQLCCHSEVTVRRRVISKPETFPIQVLVGTGSSVASRTLRLYRTENLQLADLSRLFDVKRNLLIGQSLNADFTGRDER